MEFLITLAPFIVLFGLILGAKKSVLTASFWAALTMVMSAWWWGAEALTASGALGKAGLVTFDIGLILVGALLFLNTLKTTTALEKIKSSLLSISADKRVQAIIIGVFFVGLVEGLAGFGTPAMLAAPLLAALGLRLPIAVLVALLGNAVVVPFGAAGTPLLIGLEQGAATLANYGPAVFESTLHKLLIINLPALILVPTVISLIVSHDQFGNWKKGLEIWRFSLMAGLVYAASVVGIALFLGPEFPALLGAILAGTVMIVVLKFTSIVPYGPSEKSLTTKDQTRLPSLAKSLAPTGLVIGLLLVSRIDFLPAISTFFDFFQVELNLPFGEARLIHRLNLATSPGLYLILGSLLASWLLSLKTKAFFTLTGETLKKSLRPILSLLCLIFITQLLLFSSFNNRDLPSIPVWAATQAIALPLPWIVLAPVVGLLGALVTGSVTVSNLLFAAFQGQAAELSQSSLDLVLAAQILGAAAGNLIALHNLIAVATTLGAKDKEGDYLKLMIKPALIMMLSVSLLALLWANWPS